MKKILIYLVANIILISCSTPKQIPIETRVVTNVKDSLVIKDSVVITPIERIVDIVPQYNLLRLETSLAYSETFLDTTLHVLRGKIENKIQPKKEYKFKEHILTVKDTVYIEKPYPVEVEKKYFPKFYKCNLIYSILLSLVLGFIIWLRFKSN